MADRVVGLGFSYGKSFPLLIGSGSVTAYFDQSSWIPTLAVTPGLAAGGGVGLPVSVDLIMVDPAFRFHLS